jgi:hypothetical protein
VAAHLGAALGTQSGPNPGSHSARPLQHRGL